MKKSLTTFILSLAAAIAAQAQVIPAGSRWFDGDVLYTAHPRAGGHYIYFDGISAHEGGFEFSLERINGKAGEYKLIPSAQADIAPFRSEFSSRVQYVRLDGMYFLAVRNPKGDITWTLTLTPDNVEDCTANERWAEEQPTEEMLGGFLMNTTYLSRFSKAELKQMQAKLQARKGKRSIIEETNLSLIRSEIAVPDEDRFGMEQEPTEGAPTGEVFHAANEQDFIAALGSDRTVYINDDVHLNLTPLLDTEDFFTDVFGRAFVGDAEPLASLGHPVIASESGTDGQQLSLVNVRNLTIVGGKNTSIVVEPRYAFVLNFINCENIRVENLVLGHTEEGFCDGGVVGLRHCSGVEISRCDLYGCGTYGIEAFGTSNLLVQNSVIRDCSYGIIQLHSSRDVYFARCDFHRNREYDLVYADAGCQRVTFDDCRFWNNNGMLFLLDTGIQLKDCEIHHDGDFGTTERITELGRDGTTT
ncbi:MAG: right-handed parallel beta-helix repeat-containing protein [Alloprevotella sp.]|nr:right-handed parallel beta-helix repeat-containing protein [Alloprevotella sp.]